MRDKQYMYLKVKKKKVDLSASVYNCHVKCGNDEMRVVGSGVAKRYMAVVLCVFN